MARRKVPGFLWTHVRRLFGRFAAFYFYDEYKQWHYSQEGEDVILARIFEHHSSGFYVDIGAHHPRRFSNTRLLAEKGWTGINVDPLPGVMKLFRKDRPADINLEIAISQARGFATYFIFNESALNSLSSQLSLAYDELPNDYRIVGKTEVETWTLESVLDKWLGARHIDVLSIDVEGHDWEVLASNNWQRYRPGIVLVESSHTDALGRARLTEFMTDRGYFVLAQTMQTLFFRALNPGTPRAI